MNRPKNSIPDELMSRISAVGATVAEAREISHATQYRLSSGSDSATLNVYDTGKVVEGGKESALKNILRDYRNSQPGKRRKSANRNTVVVRGPGPGTTPVPNPTPRVGTDEAGKGEYIGPLVVAGVRVMGGEVDARLREAGVRDSKDLGLARVRKLAGEVLDIVGEENAAVIPLAPRDYEIRRAAAGDNVNKLLGELNIEIIRKLQGNVELAVVDAFGVKAGEYVRAGNFEGLRVEARPKAEDDAAVAAASILARAKYLEEMDVLSGTAGFDLPRGSSDVLWAARRVYEERGEDGLRDIAKFHFATTKQVMESSRKRGETA